MRTLGRWKVVLGLVLATGAWAWVAPLRSQGQNPPSPQIVLEGLDPVLLLQGKEVQGKESIKVTRGLMQYIFASEENKTAFEKDPEHYAVQLDGACARMGPGSRGNPDLWAVVEGKVYLFASENCRKAFTANPQKFFEPVRQPLATGEASARARQLLAKAADAMGGAQKLAALTAVQWDGTWLGPSGNGEFPQSLVYAFPDRMGKRQEATMNSQAGMMTTVITPGDSFVWMKQGESIRTFTMIPTTRDRNMKDFKRNPLWVVRASSAPGFAAAVAGQAKVGETSVENVDAEFDGLRMTLAIDPSSGRILRLSYLDRTADGFATIEETYSDFKTVEGISLPLSFTATADGKPFGQRYFKARDFSVNQALPENFFQRPPRPPQQ